MLEEWVAVERNPPGFMQSLDVFLTRIRTMNGRRFTALVFQPTSRAGWNSALRDAGS